MMNSAQQLPREEAEWLMTLSRGRSRKTPYELGIPRAVVSSLLRKGLIVRRGCYLEITTHGLADALRLSVPDRSHLEFMSPSRYGDARLAIRGF